MSLGATHALEFFNFAPHPNHLSNALVALDVIMNHERVRKDINNRVEQVWAETNWDDIIKPGEPNNWSFKDRNGLDITTTVRRQDEMSFMEKFQFSMCEWVSNHDDLDGISRGGGEPLGDYLVRCDIQRLLDKFSVWGLQCVGEYQNLVLAASDHDDCKEVELPMRRITPDLVMLMVPSINNSKHAAKVVAGINESLIESYKDRKEA